MAEVKETEPVAAVEQAAAEEKDRKTGSVHFGDEGFDELETEDIGEATWGEVCQACCVHTPKDWGMIFVASLGVLFFLYWFIFSLELLGTGAKVLTGCTAGALFGDNMNPIASLMIGILCTVLLQSSSTTTSIIVSLVGSGAIAVEPAIYMVMGANIGTSVTNTIVAMGQMGDGAQLERAFAGATVHDMFNYLSVAVLLPIEAATHYLAALTQAMTKNWTPSDGGGKKVKGIKVIISPILDQIIKANKKVIDEVANGVVSSCDAYYPVECVDGVESYNNCVKNGRIGLITCSKETGKCPAFFQDGATQADDQASGGVSLFMGILFLVLCLIGLVSILQKMLLGASTRVIYKATNLNGYFAMVVGAGITALVQSSSVTTSCLTPLVGLGVIQLEQMFPLTLGANIGTTVTSLMAATVADEVHSMQVALAHFFFNVTGIIIWYPIPFMRRVPLTAARTLGKATKWWRGFPFLYLAVMFFVLPLVLLGVSSLIANPSAGFKALGIIIACFLGLGVVYFIYWWRFKDGKTRTRLTFKEKERRRATYQTLPDDMEMIKVKLDRLEEHTCLPSDEEVKPLTDGDETSEAEASELNEENPEGNV